MLAIKNMTSNENKKYRYSNSRKPKLKLECTMPENKGVRMSANFSFTADS